MQADAKVREMLEAKKPEAATPIDEQVEGETTESNEVALLDEVAAADSLTKDSVDVTALSLFSYLRPNYTRQGPMQGPVVGMSLARDTAKVNAYFADSKIKSLFPKDVKFMWTVKPVGAEYMMARMGDKANEKETAFNLVAIKASTHDGRPPLEGDVITNARSQTDQRGQFEVSMSMNAEGAKTWARLTKSNIGKSVAIVLDGFVYSFPTVNDEIKGGRSSISGNFTPEESQDLANILKSA